jgi:hypothetical protein
MDIKKSKEFINIDENEYQLTKYEPNEKYNRDFKGVWIPKEIWLDKNLTLQEKCFLVEIDSLDNENGCFASNNYFAKFFKLTPQRCSQVINNLIEKKYIIAKYFKKGDEIIKRVLNIFDRGIKYSYKGIKNSLGGYQENFKDNNILINNTINNISNEPENIFTLLKDKYNSFMLNMMKYSQDEINEIIWNDDKEIKQLILLLKRFDSIDNLESFLRVSYKDKWLKEKCCMPSILNSQYSKILAQVKLKKHEKIKHEEKQNTMYTSTEQARKKREKEKQTALAEIHKKNPELDKKFNKFLGVKL